MKPRTVITTVALVSTWIGASRINKSAARDMAFQQGLSFSSKFRNVPGWDTIVEPCIIKQFGFLFSVGNSFMKGMISDNKTSLDDELKNVIHDSTLE